jgi:hypothetical protein
MENEKAKVARQALGRAGWIAINPPAGYVERVCPALWKAAPVLRAFLIRPESRKREKALAGCLERAAAAFQSYAPSAFNAGHVTEDQFKELLDVAVDLRGVAFHIENFNPAANA